MREALSHVVAAASQSPNDIWGDVPTWIAVIGALAGAGLALWQLRGQQREFARQGRILERKQADDVDFSWIRVQAEDITLQISAGPLEPAERSVWIVTNASKRPIHNVACGITLDVPGLPRQAFAPERVGPLLDGDPPLFDPWNDTEVPLIRASRSFGFLFRYPIEPGGFPAEGTSATVHFTDDAGLKWQVDNDLHLAILGR